MGLDSSLTSLTVGCQSCVSLLLMVGTGYLLSYIKVLDALKHCASKPECDIGSARTSLQSILICLLKISMSDLHLIMDGVKMIFGLRK